jgi:hypothetical protein
MDEALADKDAQPSSFVENTGFSALVKLADPSYIIPGRRAIRGFSIVYAIKLELCQRWYKFEAVSNTEYFYKPLSTIPSHETNSNSKSHLYTTFKSRMI